MLERIRAVVPAVALAGASVLLLTPAAHAATTPTPAIYTDGEVNNLSGGPGGYVWTYDGSDPAPGARLNGATVWDAATSPGGKIAYLLVNDGTNLQVLTRNVATGSVGAAIASFAAPNTLGRIALSPDGAIAYVSEGDRIHAVTLSSGAVSAAFDPGADVRALAASQDGRFLYVSARDQLLKLNASTGAVLDRVWLGQPAGAIKLSADGATAYVVGDTRSMSGGAKLFKVALSSFTVAESTALPGDSVQQGQLTGFGLALSPDQAVAYVSYSVNHPSNGNGNDVGAYVVPVQTSNLSVGAPIGITTDITTPDMLDLAFTPDGNTVYGYVRDRSGSEPVFTIDATTNTLSSKTATTSPGNFFHIPNMSSVVVPADEAPVAKFKATAACAGTATAFDASSSTVAQGKIVRYAWDFGDGTKKVTTGPKVKHVYAKPGSYAASVTETDSAGTSTTVVFDGQTVLRNGKPTARARHTIAISACAVTTPPTTPPAGSESSVGVTSLPMTGSGTGPALMTAGLLIGAGAVLTRAGRRRVRG